MDFIPYNRPPQFIDFLNLFPAGDYCRHPVMSTSDDAKPWFTELSLGVKAPVTTSSFIHHSRLLKRKRLSLHQGLVDAAKSFTLYLSPSDNAPVTTSNLAIDYSATPISCIPPQDPPKKTTYPTCGDILKKKKRTKKVNNCGQQQVANEQQFQIVCWDPLATQPTEEPEKKKRKITPKIKSGPVVKNDVTERLQKFITGDEMNGSDLKLVIQKVLYMSDLLQSQNRLIMPFKKLETQDFLTPEERLVLENEEKSALENEKEIEVRLVGPTLKMYKDPMRLVIWKMTNNRNLALKTNWYRFVEENKEHLKEFSKIQLWSFRKDHQLCFALAVVARPPEGLNSSTCC